MKPYIFILLLLLGGIVSSYALSQNNASKSAFSHNESYAGEMDEFGNIIVYNRYMDLWRKDLVWYHERCHVVFEYILTRYELEEYKQIFLNSTHSLETIKEDFAENCRRYITMSELDKETEQFFNKIKSKLQLLKLRGP